MKKILLFVGLGIFSAGCETVLETSPFNSVTDASAFSTADRCLLTLNGVYDAAQGSFYTSGTTENRGYPFGAANIEQGDARGEDVINVQAFYQITYQGTYNADSPNCVAHWKGIYALINKANVAIAGFRLASQSGILTQEQANQYEAESRFLRALSHHEALLHWARPYLDGNGNQVGIPYREEPITSSTAVTNILNSPRMRVDSVYNKILADLDYAEANLPAKIFTYRATKAAAIALKMRIKTHKGDWAGVVADGNKLVPATVNPMAPSSIVSPIGGWALTASPDGPFSNNNSTESIFSVKNDPLDTPSTNAGLSRMYGAANLNGRGLLSLSPVLYNDPQWLCTDKRRTLLTVAGTNSAGTQSIFSTKYRDYASWGDYSPQIRYAEVLLTLAEAEARVGTGVSTRAMDLLNAVRNRSLAAPATEAYTAASFTNKVDLVKKILKERRIEFLAEGKRWNDISRLVMEADYSTGGIPAKAINGTAGLNNFACGVPFVATQPAIPYSDYRFVWAIPATEVTQNPVIKQNPNY
jgi:hypothetical protein